MTHSSKNEFWKKKTAVTNINIFSITCIPRSFNDQIWRTHKYILKLKDTHSSYPTISWDKKPGILPIATVGNLSLLLPL